MEFWNSIFGPGKEKRYGTGMWPFYYKRPWDFNPPPGIAAITDPLAVAFEASTVFTNVGWPGTSIMGTDFLLSVLDDEATAEIKIERWFEGHRNELADEVANRLPKYNAQRFSTTALTAMAEAIASYRTGSYLSVVRILMPEFEGIGRSLVTNRVSKTSQKKVIDDLQAAINHTPLMQDDALEMTTLHNFIENDLFAKCHTESEAALLGTSPNRHAELHGLTSYGDLRGATFILCAMDLLLKLAGRLLDLGWQAPH